MARVELELGTARLWVWQVNHSATRPPGKPQGFPVFVINLPLNVPFQLPASTTTTTSTSSATAQEVHYIMMFYYIYLLCLRSSIHDRSTLGRQQWQVTCAGQTACPSPAARLPSADILTNDKSVGHPGGLLSLEGLWLLPSGWTDTSWRKTVTDQCLQHARQHQVCFHAEHQSRWSGN